jgi:hypothetical protein
MTQSLETSLSDLHRLVDQLAHAWQVRDVVTLRAMVQRFHRGARQRGLMDVAACAASLDESLSLLDEADSSEITETIESLVLLCTRAVAGQKREKR